MHTHRPGARHWQLQRIAELARFDVEVVQDFHVIGEKADGSQHHRTREIALFHLAQIVENIGLQPWLPWCTTAALIHERMVGNAKLLRDEFRYFF